MHRALPCEIDGLKTQARVNQHLPAHHKGWTMGGQGTLFHQVPGNYGGYRSCCFYYLPTNKPTCPYLCTNHLHVFTFSPTYLPTYLHTGSSLYTIGYDSESWHQLSLGSSIHNCVITGFQWMVHWWLLVCSGPLVIVLVVLEQCRMCKCSIIAHIGHLFNATIILWVLGSFSHIWDDPDHGAHDPCLMPN
jgi:hypothetical protein